MPRVPGTDEESAGPAGNSGVKLPGAAVAAAAARAVTSRAPVAAAAVLGSCRLRCRGVDGNGRGGSQRDRGRLARRPLWRGSKACAACMQPADDFEGRGERYLPCAAPMHPTELPPAC